MDAYERSARIYDLLYTRGAIMDFAADAAAVHGLVQRTNRGARTLLDVGCGTGLHLAQLRQWYDVAGVDRSSSMLAVARSRLGRDVLLQPADMRDFDLERQFDVVTCLFSSIGYLTNDDDLRHAFQRFADHLTPGGVLVVDGWVRPDAWRDGYAPPPEQADDGATTVVRLVRSKRDGRLTTLEQHHLVRDATGIDHFFELHALMLVPSEQYVAAAEAAGLSPNVVRDYMPDRDRIVAVKPR
jgi:SAM-dependent methyltransferase